MHRLVQVLHGLLLVLYLRQVPKQDHTVMFKFTPYKGIDYSPVGLGLLLPHPRPDLLVLLQNLVLQVHLFDLVALVHPVHLEVQLNHLVQVDLAPLVDPVHLYFPMDRGFQYHPSIKLSY